MEIRSAHSPHRSWTRTPSAPIQGEPEALPVAADSVALSHDSEPESAGPAGQEERKLVKVSHPREMRGAWVASVWNINFPSKPGLSAETQKAELVNMLDILKNTGFNAVFFQVRPEGDALYESQLEPWSSSLTGKQGQFPGYDPLKTLVEEAHKRNIEVHAWLNPYRAKAASAEQVPPHVAAVHPEHVHDYGKVKWMDPGAQVVRQRLVDVCADITKRYDVDGIHFDDYFYPYPIEGKDFPDQKTWTEYQKGGGTLSRADWRRENVNTAVREVKRAVKSQKSHVRFGISPFGLPAPDRPADVVGFNQYEGLYADTQKWMDRGWVDYLAPQLYWPTTKKGQPYETLVKYWNEHSSGGRAIFAGNNLAAIGSSSEWTIDEYRKQVNLSRQHSGAGGAGNIWWHVDPILKDKPGVRAFFKDEVYKEPALTPALPNAAARSVRPPSFQVRGNQIEFAAGESELRGLTVYRQEGDSWKLEKVLPGDARQAQLTPGTWAIAAADRHGAESLGVVVEIA